MELATSGLRRKPGFGQKEHCNWCVCLRVFFSFIHSLIRQIFTRSWDLEIQR